MKEECKNYIVNTNRRYFPTAYNEMLNKKRAAAYGNRRHGIEKLKEKDTVFLFHNRIGVIGYGTVISNKFVPTYNDSFKLEENYVNLSFVWRINPDTRPNEAITAQQINTKLPRPQFFGETVRCISQETANSIKGLVPRSN